MRAGCVALLAALASCGGPSAPDEPRTGVPHALVIAGGIDGLGLQFIRSRPYPPFPVVALDANGDTVPVPSPLSFASRNEDVLTVDADGSMWLRQPGDAWVVVRAESGRRVLADSIRLFAQCTADLRPVLAPREATLRVGEELAPPTLRIMLCQGEMEDTDEVTWRAREPEILEVHPATGAARALGPGTTALIATGRKYGYLNAVDVVVVP